MQPHQPFFGPTGESIEHKAGFSETVRRNNIDNATIRRAYQRNLQIALDSISELLTKLNGKVVISADHGELLGDTQPPVPVGSYYGHPAGLYVPELVKVPWFVIESDSRKRIRSEPP